MRRGAQGKRRDANEPAIVDALKRVGATVRQLSGTNLPDLLVGFMGGNWLFEVKTAKGKLSDGQAIAFDRWAGNINVVRFTLDVMRGGFVRDDGALIGHAKLIGIGRSGMRVIKAYAAQHGIGDWEAFELLCLNPPAEQTETSQGCAEEEKHS